MEWGVDLVFEEEIESASLWDEKLVGVLGDGEEDLEAFCGLHGLTWIAKFASVTADSWKEATGEPPPPGLGDEIQWHEAKVVLRAIQALLPALEQQSAKPADDDEEMEDEVFQSHADGPRVLRALRVLEGQLVEAQRRGIRCHYVSFEL